MIEMSNDEKSRVSDILDDLENARHMMQSRNPNTNALIFLSSKIYEWKIKLDYLLEDHRKRAVN